MGSNTRRNKNLHLDDMTAIAGRIMIRNHSQSMLCRRSRCLEVLYGCTLERWSKTLHTRSHPKPAHPFDYIEIVNRALQHAITFSDWPLEGRTRHYTCACHTHTSRRVQSGYPPQCGEQWQEAHLLGAESPRDEQFGPWTLIQNINVLLLLTFI